MSEQKQTETMIQGRMEKSECFWLWSIGNNAPLASNVLADGCHYICVCVYLEGQDPERCGITSSFIDMVMKHFAQSHYKQHNCGNHM